MKQVLKSHLLHLVTRIYKATTFFKTFWNFFVFTYFLMRFLPTHRGAWVKTQVSILRPGYIMQGWKICIKLTKLPNYCCNDKKYLAFYTYPGYFFLKKSLMENAENTISEPLDFKIFWGRMPPDPHYKLTSPTLVMAMPYLY